MLRHAEIAIAKIDEDPFYRGKVESAIWFLDDVAPKIAARRRAAESEDGSLMGAKVRAGTVDFHLSQDDFAKGRDRAKGEGFRFYCRTAQDVDELAEAIKSRGGSLDMEPTDMPFGARIFAVTDPDGFKISIGREG